MRKRVSVYVPVIILATAMFNYDAPSQAIAMFNYDAPPQASHH